MRLRRPTRALVLATTALLLLALPACSSSAGDDAGPVTVDLDGATEADFEVTGNTGAVTVTGAEPDTSLQLVNPDGEVQTALFSPGGLQDATGTVDDEGNLVFARVEPGAGYRVVRVDDAGDVAASDPIAVGDVYDHPPQSLYTDQELVPGLNYIATRDGTTLVAMVRLPGPVEDGPYPTVINYSGYDSANPNGSGSSISQFADLYGYATVSVNVRGTGCSGGTFSFFEASQVADGYDVVEAVAAQDWVAHHEPGLIGISYAGNSQLFVAATRPPHLAAISPMSVLDSIWPAVLYPGGMYNSGFARNWILAVQDGAEPYGQGWERAVVDQGGEIGRQCEANQGLRSQNPDIERLARNYPHYDPVISPPLTPVTFADRINVPVFLAGSWQDEQTGGHFPALIEHLTGSPDVHVSMQNGTHGDSLIPQNVQRWFEFLDFYVAKRIPEIPPLIRAGAPAAFIPQFGEGDYFIPPDRFTDAASYEEALADYQAEDDIRVLYENGARTDTPGIPGSTFEETYVSWPPPDVEPTAFYLQPDGTLGPDAPTAVDGEPTSAASFEFHPEYGDDRTVPGGFSFTADPGFDWKPLREGDAVSYLSEPFDDATVMAGPASANLWIESTALDTDLEVTISEVRPDGKEVYIQNGWLRASHRSLDDEASTELRPVPTHLDAEDERLPVGELTEVRVEVFPFAHAFHPGSRLRFTVDSPGGDRPEWEFDSRDAQGVVNTVAQSADHPSALVLPVLPGDHDVPAERPGCTSLRGQPCRDYVEIDNTPAG